MHLNFSNFYKILNPAFWEAFENKSRIRVLLGGAGSGKSFFAFQEMIYNVVVYDCNYLVVRQTGNSHKTSTYALTKKIISDLDLWDVFKENKSDLTFTCKINNSMIVFRGLEDPERLKSISFPGGSGVLERILIEEASEINLNSFSQLMIRLRGQSSNFFQITLLLNPISSVNWVKKTFFDKTNFNAYIHRSTYLDNLFIDDDYKATLESFKETDEQFYNIYALGHWGNITGLVFNHWEALKFPFKREEIEDEILYGCDWGFNHPTALTLSYISDNCLYTFDEIIGFELTNMEFLKYTEEMGIVPKTARVTADDEDPARIKEFQQNGYSFVPAKKGKGSVLRTIDYVKSFKRWYVDPKCVRLLQELEQYHWRVDKDGSVLDEPVKLVDDAISAIRYSVEHLANMKGRPSILSGTQSDAKKDLIEVKRLERKKRRDVIKAQNKKKKELLKKQKKELEKKNG